MKFSYQWLKELAGFRESPERLADFLTLRAFEVESISAPYPREHLRDRALDIKLFPNRVADASGHVGMAEEIARLKKGRCSRKPPELREDGKRRAAEALRVRIQKPDDCPRYTARVMTGVAVHSSPAWLRERLEVCGIQSINNIVDAANYVMLELGQPLHVFDAQKIRGRTIIVRRARRGETLLALDEKKYALGPEILAIADQEHPIAIAGIKGGKASGVSRTTREIVLESANFDPVRTRIASEFLKLKTDAAYRFERGMDPNQTAYAVDRLAEVIGEIAGGTVLAGRVDAYPRLLRAPKILLRQAYANRLIGAKLSPKFIEGALDRLGWEHARKGSDWHVQPPTNRRDVQIEEDVIEELVRLLGYERIPASAPTIHLLPASPPEEREWESSVKDVLVAGGLSEAYLYAFTGEKLLDIFGSSRARLLEIENPVSSDMHYLAAHPAERLIAAVAENLRYAERVGLFTIARGFKRAVRPNRNTPSDEGKYVAIALADRSGNKGADGETFYRIKGLLDHLFESLGISEHWYDDALAASERASMAALHPFRRAKVKADGETLGVIAELHPRVQERLKAKARIVFAELSFDKLWRMARAEAEFRPIGKFPAIIRDIAVMVPENTKTESVTNVIEAAGGRLLVDSDLFDYFQDEAMTERGQKSLAFHLIFQSPERTLTDAEVGRLAKNISAALSAKGWEIRD